MKDDGVSKQLKDKARYQSMVGSLLYAALATRPDIALAVGDVLKLFTQPIEAHLTAVKRMLRYLSGTRDIALQYQKSEEPPTGYSDAITMIDTLPLVTCVFLEVSPWARQNINIWGGGGQKI